MAGFVPAAHVFVSTVKVVDGRHKASHDGRVNVKGRWYEIDLSSESAALRHRRTSSKPRATWDRQTWRRYLTEAVLRTQLHARETAGSRCEAVRLELRGRHTCIPSTLRQPCRPGCLGRHPGSGHAGVASKGGD